MEMKMHILLEFSLFTARHMKLLCSQSLNLQTVLNKCANNKVTFSRPISNKVSDINMQNYFSIFCMENRGDVTLVLMFDEEKAKEIK